MIGFLNELFFKDFWLKLFSLALAVLIWLTVSFAIRKEVSPSSSLGGMIVEKTFANIPVVVMSSAADVRNFKVDPSEVTVQVEGDSKLMQTLQAKDVRALVDLTDIESPRDITKRIEISTPPGITYVSIFPTDAVHITAPAKH